MKKEVKEKADKQGASVGPKKKKIVEQAVFAEILNSKLELAHSEIVQDIFKHNLLHYFLTENSTNPDFPKECVEYFKKAMKASNPTSN